MFKELRVKINLNKLVEAQQKIKQANNILLVTHENPDGDAIGSMVAMMEYLKQFDKNYVAWCVDEIPNNLEYLSQSYDINNEVNKLIANKFDLIVTVDCGSINHSGIGDILRNIKNDRVDLVNIDHHPGDYGTINLVDIQASSTSIILYEIFKFWKIKITNNMATALLAGVLTDTGSFSNNGTTTTALDITAELISLGAKFGQVNNNIYKSKSNQSLKFWAKVLLRLRKNDKLKVVYSVILQEDIIGMSANDVDGVANFFNYLEGANISMVLKELDDNQIKVSLRSIANEINVAQIAKFFGGGGHGKAAGFIIQGTLEEEGGNWRIV